MKQALQLWLKHVLIAIDQALNALCGGWPDETFSSRCWRNCNRPGWKQIRLVVDFVARLFGDVNHCEESYISEELRRQSPPELRPRGESK
jgi:hypothetical protein